MQNDKKWVCVEIPLQVTDIRVWAALTDPKLTQRYMYNCQLQRRKIRWNIYNSRSRKSIRVYSTHKTSIFNFS